MTETNQRRDSDGSVAAGTSLDPVINEEELRQQLQPPDATAGVAAALRTHAPQDVPASSRWDRATKRTVVVMLVVVGSILLWLMQPVLPILIFAGIIAYLLSPLVDLLERLHVPRGLSTILLFTLLLVGFILLPVLLIPVLLNQLSSLANYNPQQITHDVIV
ncbi:MAG: AI-2E family transporter, partial [Caldilineaceae bacterium]|nr:AI-2E family transporter [Caldilineaceae bacterium]